MSEYEIKGKTMEFRPCTTVNVTFNELSLQIIVDTSQIELKDLVKRLYAAADYLTRMDSGLDPASSPIYLELVGQLSKGNVSPIGMGTKYAIGRTPGSFSAGPFDSTLEAMKQLPYFGDCIYELPSEKVVCKCVTNGYWEMM